MTDSPTVIPYRQVTTVVFSDQDDGKGRTRLYGRSRSGLLGTSLIILVFVGTDLQYTAFHGCILYDTWTTSPRLVGGILHASKLRALKLGKHYLRAPL